MNVATGPVCGFCEGSGQRERRDPKTRLLKTLPCLDCGGRGRTGPVIEIADAS